MTNFYHVEEFSETLHHFTPCFGNATRDYCQGWIDAMRECNPSKTYQMIATDSSGKNVVPKPKIGFVVAIDTKPRQG